MIVSTYFDDYPAAYPTLDRIPQQYRLENFESVYEGTNLWAEFVEEQYIGEGYSDRTRRRLRNTGEKWVEFCESKDVHHGLAPPDVIDEWIVNLIEERSRKTVYEHYLSYINMMYRYLMWNVEYPHVYNPVQYAIQMFEATKFVWYNRKSEGECK